MATPPVKLRTYSVITPTTVTAQGTTLATNKLLLRTMVNALITAGCTVDYSCNSVTAGTVGDGVNRWSADSDIVFANAGSAHSWMVLNLPAGIGLKILFDCGNNGTTTNGLRVRTANAFSSGSTTTLPSANDGSSSGMQLNSGVPALLSTNITTRLSVVYATDGTSIRVIITNNADDTNVVWLLLEKISNSPTEYTEAFGGAYASSSAAALSVLTLNFVSYRFDVTGSGSGGLVTNGTPWLDGTYTNLSDIDGYKTIFGCSVRVNESTISGQTYAGYIPDLYWIRNDALTRQTTFSDGVTDYGWACWGQMVTPWNGVTALPNGTFPVPRVATLAPDNEGGGGTPPSFSSISPTSGSQLASDLTPVTFTVTNPDELPFTLWIKFVSNSRSFVVYDSLDGFKFPFNESSTVDVTDPTAPVFSLLQTGGWQSNIQEIRIGGVA